MLRMTDLALAVTDYQESYPEKREGPVEVMVNTNEFCDFVLTQTGGVDAIPEKFNVQIDGCTLTLSATLAIPPGAFGFVL